LIIVKASLVFDLLSGFTRNQYNSIWIESV
jgi:hypothetical protein